MPENAALYDIYDTYCRFGGDANAASGLTSRNFVKLLKDKNIVDKKITLTVIDLAYTKAGRAATGSNYAQLDTSWGGKRINFEQFLYALELCADARGVPVEKVINKITNAEHSGPAVNGVTHAGANRFYDDKTTWTAVSKNIDKRPEGIVGAMPTSTTSSGNPTPRASAKPAAPKDTGVEAALNDMSIRSAPKAKGPAPVYNGVTKPEYNRFYDDKSTWTKMHLAGGPDHGPKRGSSTAKWSGGLRN
mmetsp:Transcript_3759/g.12540  ORF Transcript_3759/g.12540 Transcript_3759/m.12540 type:complete len:247 (-) Transcript_3759:459-1199(-)